MRFSYRMVPEVYQVFWAGMAAGEFINDAAIAAAVIASGAAVGWLRRAGSDLVGVEACGVVSDVAAAGRDRARPGPRATPFGPSLRSSAGHRRRCRGSCAATPTDWVATGPPPRMHWPTSTPRPKPGELVQNLELRGKVEAELAKKYSRSRSRAG